MDRDKDKDIPMSEAERRQAEAIGHHVVARLLELAQNPETVSNIVETWTGVLQKAIGRAVLRFVFYVVIAAVSFLMLNDKIVHFIRDMFK